MWSKYALPAVILLDRRDGSFFRSDLGSKPSCFASCFVKHRGYLWSVGSERGAKMHPHRSQRSRFAHYLVYVTRSSDKRGENLFCISFCMSLELSCSGAIGLFLQKLHRPAEQDKSEAAPGFGTKRNLFQMRFKSLSNHQYQDISSLRPNLNHKRWCSGR